MQQQTTIQCKNCGLLNWAHLPACVRCNAALYYNQPQSRQGQSGLPPRQNPVTSLSGKEFATYVGVALGVALMVFGFIYKAARRRATSIPSPPASVARPAPPAGQTSPARPAPTLQDAFNERTIRSRQRVFVATTEVNYLDLTQALAANDQSALSTMRNDGKILELTYGTKVKIIESGNVSSRVSILDGTHAGKSGRIANEFLKR